MNRKRSYIFLLRITSAVLVLFIYLYGLRPVREAVTQQIALPVIAPHHHNAAHPFSIMNKGTALTLSFEWNNGMKTIRYQPQMGFFFLIAVIALIFITSKPRWYVILFAGHLLATFIVLGVLFISRQGWYPGFIMVDLLASYLIPGLSFAYAAGVYHFETHASERLFSD